MTKRNITRQSTKFTPTLFRLFVLVIIVFAAWLIIANYNIIPSNEKYNPIHATEANKPYMDSLQQHRMEKDLYFADSITSPLNKDSLFTFKGLRYFDPDIRYKIEALLIRDPLADTFTMPTTTDRLPRYRRFGIANFSVKGESLQLSVFQNVDLLDKNPDSKYLFLPFKDLSNGDQTYGGGRYLDLKIPEGDTLIIDFNLSYNPLCVYDDRWSCPLTPFENYLDVYIPAGEKKYP